MSARDYVTSAARRWRCWWGSERGSVTSEAVLVAPVLVMLLVLVAVVCHRGVDARLRLDDAAHQAARAATITRNPTAAATAARATADTALADSGLVCRSVTTTIAGAVSPGATVTVTVACVVDFGQALLLAVPTTRQLVTTASEVVDRHRSQPPRAAS